MRILAVFLTAVSLPGQTMPLDWRAALNRVRASSIQGHLSFLASDLLEGRDTPSRGLDIAAEYIASQFRRAGLEPAGNNGYYHDTPYTVLRPGRAGEIVIASAAGSFVIAPGESSVWLAKQVELRRAAAAVYRYSHNSDAAPAPVSDLVVMTVENMPRNPAGAMDRMQGVLAAARVRTAVVLDPDGRLAAYFGRPRLVKGDASSMAPPVNWIFVRARSAAALAGLPAGTSVQVTAAASPVANEPFALRNVAGILRGSDPVLRGTYVLVTAHYDHVGRRSGQKDEIYNGANDDASGVSAVVEMADALSRLPVRPRRSVLFMALAGEEKGLLGARAFAANPTVPLADIAANINCEHLGRVDTHQGPHKGRANVTGFEFSTLTGAIVEAGKETGFEIYHNKELGDRFFRASDNLAFAEKGIPAHTVSTAYTFDGYHQPHDEWDRIDYAQMEQLTRVIALAVLRVAGSGEAPRWNESMKETELFRRAR